MPLQPPHVCSCGFKVPHGVLCECQLKRARERNARHDANRPSARKRGYDRDWQRERAAFLATDPTCRRCGKPATVVDHILPHRGNQALFWNRSNWQPLCTSCHARAKQAQEHRERSK